MKKLKGFLDKFLLIVTSVLLSVMSLLSIYQVIARFIFDSPSTTSEEIIRFCLVWLALLSAAYVFGQKKHIAIVFIQEKLPGKLHDIINIFIDTLVLIMSLVLMIWGGYEVIMNTLSQAAPATGLSMAIMYSSLLFSGAFVLFYSVYAIMYSDEENHNQQGGETL